MRFLPWLMTPRFLLFSMGVTLTGEQKKIIHTDLRHLINSKGTLKILAYAGM
jgi:hypothetical protein